MFVLFTAIAYGTHDRLKKMDKKPYKKKHFNKMVIYI